MTARPILWQPNPGPQYAFVASGAYEVLYGGAAGGGKSEALLIGAARRIEHSSYRALLLRRTYPELEASLIDRARSYYPKIDPRANYNESKRVWTFASGAKIQFGHCEYDKDVNQYQGAEYQYLGFDELTHFTQRQYLYLLSRLRSAQGLPVRVRAATNPGGEGHEWVFARWAPWLDPTYGDRAQPGEVRWYTNTDAGEIYCDRQPGALSRAFIPARLSDNPKLGADYADRLRGLDPVTRAQLLDGNWLAKPARGEYFKRAWFDLVDTLPAVGRRCRYWDRAATKDGDWTVGVKALRTPDGLYYIEDVVRLRGTPGEVAQTIKRTASLDGLAVTICLEQDPGQAGVVEREAYLRELSAYTVRSIRPTGSKVIRAGPASSQAEARNIKLRRAPWTEAFVQELEAFPEGHHDDQVDAMSGAISYLAQHPGTTHRSTEL